MNSYRHIFTGPLVTACRLVLVAVAGAGFGGCALLPTPTVVGYSEIPSKTIESFEPGKTTRAEVLLKLGEPGERSENDRVFVYHWQQVAGFSMVPTSLGGTVTNDHYLGFEFGPNNRLKRVKEFSGDWLHPLASPTRDLGQWASDKP